MRPGVLGEGEVGAGRGGRQGDQAQRIRSQLGIPFSTSSTSYSIRTNYQRHILVIFTKGTHQCRLGSVSRSAIAAISLSFHVSVPTSFVSHFSLSFFILCANDLLKLSLSIESGWLTMAMVAGVGLRVLRHLLQRSRPHLHSGPAHTEALRKGEWSALSGKINNSNSNFFR